MNKCKICGKLITNRHNSAMYCSESCYFHITRNCKTCGKDFKTNPRHREAVFCSKECNTSFIKKGSTPSNKKEKVSFICPVCGKQFFRKQCQANFSKTCSRECANKSHQKPEAHYRKVMELYKTGKTRKEISQELGLTANQVSFAINKYEYRRPNGTTVASIRRRFLKGKSCVICGFNRAVEMAHIIPARDGGTYEEENLMPLCPNHHYLFDNNKLTSEEYETLSRLYSKIGEIHGKR